MDVINVAERSEARIINTRNVLVVLSGLKEQSLPTSELSGQHLSLAEDFCGTVLIVNDLTPSLFDFSEKTVYLCGDISKANGIEKELKATDRVFVIRQLSHNFDKGEVWPIVDVGHVPILVHGVGVYYRRFFDTDVDYFHQICAEHVFQSLTESTKPATAHRTGIYLTPVEQSIDQDGEQLHFRLLRCSTNLSGPTENFRATDRHIVDALNQEAACIFQDQAPLNHVLAQIYHNTSATDEQKQTKAKIKSHADKTKDMPENGIMAFCTFYDQLDKLQSTDGFDHGYNGVSGLTKLCFRLKTPVAERPGCTLPTQFTVTLYPNSVFFMPLSTNRLYTHEIRPAALDAEKLPIRLGYVVRCSSTKAVHKNDQTFLKKDGKLSKLEPPTSEGMAELRGMYAEENKTDAFVDYGNKFPFSMNAGDYTAPDYKIADEFRCYTINAVDNLFDELQSSVQFEDQGKGRQGAVLIQPDESRGVPIVRTTSKHNQPPHGFEAAHLRLAEQIRQRASLPFAFNNTLIENYTNTYAKMGFHSDQALDLADDSYIAVFSCYKYPELANTPPRLLVIESKEVGGESVEIPLAHHSVVVFSLDTNHRFKHKIVLNKSTAPPENQWLGITFRTSKTFVHFQDDRPYFEDGEPLALANEVQQREFYAMRSRENKESNFIYPRVTYTISESDRMMGKATSARRA